MCPAGARTDRAGKSTVECGFPGPLAVSSFLPLMSGRNDGLQRPRPALRRWHAFRQPTRKPLGGGLAARLDHEAQNRLGA